MTTPVHSRSGALIPAILFGVLLFLPEFSHAALSRTDLIDSANGAVNESPFTETTASFTPPDNSLLVVVFAGANQFGPDIRSGMTISGGGLTWTRQAYAGATDGGSYYSTLEVWTAPVTTGASMTVNAAHTGGFIGTSFFQIFAYTGYDTASPIGVSTTTPSVTPTDGAGTMTITAGTPDATSALIAARLFVPTATIPTASPGTGWTEIYDRSSGDGNLQTMERLNDTSQTIAWTDIRVGGSGPYGTVPGLAVEINAAATGGTLTKPPNNLGLVGYWSFNDATSTIATDFSGRGNTGTLLGTSKPTWSNGRYGSGLSFDGSSGYVALPDAPSGMQNDNCTIAMWLRSTADSAGTLFGASQNSPTSRYFVIETGNGATANLTNELISVFSATDGGSYLVGYTTTNRGELFDGKWHHVVVTIDTAVHLYLDGSEKTTTLGYGTENGLCLGDAAMDRFRIGSQVDSGSDTLFFNGAIDDVRVYSRALSAPEIASLYGRGAVRLSGSVVNLQRGSSLASGLVGHWTLDGADTQTTIADRSGQGRHGYFIGSATSSAKTMGKLGQALDFNGSTDYVNIGSVGNVRSVAFWLNADDTTSREIMDMAGAAAQIELDGSSVLTATGFTSPTVYVDGIAGSTITAGWHHVVVTTGTDVSSTAVRVGFAGASYFDGKLDDVRLYDRALTASEAKQLYNLGVSRVTQ